MAKRNVYKIVEADTLVPTKTEDICAWWYSRINSTLWRFDEESEAWVQAIQGGGGSSYILPVATEKLLGGIKVGDGLQITFDGKLSLSEEAKPYKLPVATSSILGGVKIGGTLTMSNGVLNVKDIYTLKAATATALGGMKIGYKEDRDNNLYAVKLDTENRAYVEVPTSSGGLTEVPLATVNIIGGFKSAIGGEDNELKHYVHRENNDTYPNLAFIYVDYANSQTAGVIKIGYTPVASRVNKYLPVELGRSEIIDGVLHQENNNKAYVKLPDDLGNSGVTFIQWHGEFDDNSYTINLGNFYIEGNEEDDFYEIYTPYYTVPDVTTGLSLDGHYQFTLATANESTQGTVKTSEIWQLDQDTITDVMWNNWKDNWYYKTLKGYIKEGQIYFRQWLQHNLITSNASNLQFVEDTSKINLNLTYTPYATIATPNPKSQTVRDRDVSDHLIALYKGKADLDQTTGWIKASQLPDGFYDAYIICEAQLDETGKGKIYEDIEDPATELTPKTSALYFDTLTNISYRYVNDVDGQHQFVEVSKELVYTGGDNVEITKERQIKVKKTTGVADTYVTENEQVMPIRRLVQKYNNYLYGNLYEISTEPVEDRLYYGIPDGDEYVQKNRVYTWNATENKYVELTDNDDNVLFDNDIIIYLSEQGTKWYLDQLLQEGARGDNSYTVIAYQPIMRFYAAGDNAYTDEQIQDIACITCKDFEEVKGQLYSIETGHNTQISMPVRDYHYYDYSSSIKPDLTYELVCYKWLRNGTNGSKEDRIYDTENYYKRSYRLINIDDRKELFDTFIYQRPQMEYYPTVETSDTGIKDAYTAVQVGNTIMTAEGQDSLNFVAGDNVELDIDFDNKAVKISATGGGAVTSVNTKTGDVVLTAEDVDAYTTTEVDEKITEVNNTITAVQENVTTLEEKVTTVETNLENKQDKLTAGTNISIDDSVINADCYSQSEIDEKITTINNSINSKQDVLSEGTNISIENNVISADCYSTSEIDAKVETLNTSINKKQDSFTVDNTMIFSVNIDGQLESNIWGYTKKEQSDINCDYLWPKGIDGIIDIRFDKILDPYTKQSIFFNVSFSDIVKKIDKVSNGYINYVPVLSQSYNDTHFDITSSNTIIGSNQFFYKKSNFGKLQIRKWYKKDADPEYVYSVDFTREAGTAAGTKLYYDQLLQNLYGTVQSATSTTILADTGETYGLGITIDINSNILATEGGVIDYITGLNLKSYSAGTNITISDAGEISATDTIYDDTNVKALIAANTTAIETEKTRAEGVEATKQDKLTAGDNIIIDGTTISATDTIYDDTTVKADIETLKTNKQNKLVAGENITIDEATNTISATGGGTTTADTFKTIKIGDEDTIVASGEDMLNLKAGENISYIVNSETKTITFSATGGGTTYTAGDNISIEDNVITAKGYTYDETTKQITAEGNIGCKITRNEQQVYITIQDIVDNMMFKPNPIADPYNIAIFDENNSVIDSLYAIGQDTFAKSVIRWTNSDEGSHLFTENVDMSSVTTYPQLYSDEHLTQPIKPTIDSYDATTNSITVIGTIFQFELVIDLNASSVATEKGVINYVADKIIPEAPEDDKIYGRKNAAWVEVESGSVTINAYSKVTVGSTTATASGEDTLTIASGVGITASLDTDTKTVTIKNDGLQSVSYSAGAYATADGTTIKVALYDTQKTDATGGDIIYIDNAKNSCTQVYTTTATADSTIIANCTYALYKNDNTLISSSIENNNYKLCATGIMYFKNQGSANLTVTLPSTLTANTGSTLTTDLTPSNFYGSSEMVVSAGKTGILYIQINAIDDNFTDAIASIWGDVSIS